VARHRVEIWLGGHRRGAESEARHAGEDGVARNAEANRRLRDVPACLGEHLEQVRAHLVA
jgi:hypothetical protein